MSRGSNNIPTPLPPLSPPSDEEDRFFLPPPPPPWDTMLVPGSEISGRRQPLDEQEPQSFMRPPPPPWPVRSTEEHDYFGPFNFPSQEALTGEGSSLRQDGRKKALKKLRKEIYNPTPKRTSKRLNLYYREHNHSQDKQKQREDNVHNNDDGESCAICLDEFKAREEVTLTPCGHVYHEDCIVPWFKNRDHCPLCRSALEVGSS